MSASRSPGIPTFVRLYDILLDADEDLRPLLGRPAHNQIAVGRFD
jgi:hypothetical protein